MRCIDMHAMLTLRHLEGLSNVCAVALEHGTR
jgi:hypothetical protein